MKNNSLYAIKDMAFASGRAVFSVQQLSNLTGKKRAIATVYLSRLVKNNMAKKVRKGKITFIDDDFVIATQLVEPSYVSLDSALLYHGIIKQVPRNVECVTTRNSLNYKDLGIRYHKIPESMFFGYIREPKSGSYVMIAEPEKALLDGLYLNIYSKRELLINLRQMENINILRLKALLNQFNGRGSKKLQKVILSLIKTN
ncbi:MAG: hypothetical protein ABSA33_00460 [Candidatus Micrarchaeaceae archaeon]|jgi:predicted transcriptional regulator of viral defense system